MAPTPRVIVTIRGNAELRATVAKLRAAGQGGLLKQLRKDMRRAAVPLEQKARKNVLDIDSAGSRGGGRAQRYDYTVDRAKRLTDSVRTRAAGRKGLRAAVARATRIEAKTTGNPVIRLRTSSSLMPPDQRKLPRHMNTGQWRHPVRGSDRWVTQTVVPHSWFNRAAIEEGPLVRDGARRALDTIIEGIG